MPIEDGFPRPEWSAIAELIHAGPESTSQAGWEERSKRLLDSILDQLPGSYRIKESENFYPDEGEFMLSSGTFLNAGYWHLNTYRISAIQ